MNKLIFITKIKTENGVAQANINNEVEIIGSAEIIKKVVPEMLKNEMGGVIK